MGQGILDILASAIGFKRIINGDSIVRLTFIYIFSFGVTMISGSGDCAVIRCMANRVGMAANRLLTAASADVSLISLNLCLKKVIGMTRTIGMG